MLLVLSFANSTLDKKVFRDSLGRPFNTQVLRPNGSWDTTTTYFDALGRPTFVTFPCSALAAATCPKTGPGITTSYDALGRVTSISDGHGRTQTFTYTWLTKTICVVGGPCSPIGNFTDVLTSGMGKTTNNEYDAQGRLVSVCEISSQSGSAPCDQGVAKTGFRTAYTYNTVGNLTSVIQGAQTRTFQYDQLSRLTLETNPENGQTQYFYDTAPSTPGVACAGTFNGSLVKKYDANGNTTCYTYDGLGRALSITYSGPNDSGTNKYFVYDSATVNGVPMTNTAGRLAEAYTAASQAGTKITDEGFSYGARGELAEVYESTPHSGGYYHTKADYFANGAVSGLSGIPGQATWAFGLDGKGRPQTATWGTTAEVTDTAYDAADRPLVITLGLGDTDTYAWDSNTGHLNSYLFSVGSTPTTLKGTLGYSTTTGLPTSLAIVDGFNSVNSQSCTYGYDDMARANSANCGTTWAQTFSYDMFGNVTKSGSIAWTPGYTASTNRYLGASTYDVNGNLTFDTFHNYTWNVDNKITSIDTTTTVIYDAFNNAVEKTAAGATTEFLYTPLGKTATMTGQTVVKFFLPLPGGAGFEFLTSGGYQLFHHKDGLGSSRFVSKRALRASYFDTSFAPFGEDYNGSGTSAELNFTNQRQDLVAGTYDFLAREYNPKQGRWISSDPAGMAVVDPSNPQSWNRYAYVLGSPLSLIDPLGLEDAAPCDADQCITVTADPPPDVATIGFGGTLDPALIPLPMGPKIVVPPNNTTQQPQTKQQCVAAAQSKFNSTMDTINSRSIWPSVTLGASFGTLTGAAWGCFNSTFSYALCQETWGGSALVPAINGGISGGAGGATKWLLQQTGDMAAAQNAFTQQVNDVCSKLPG